MAGKARACLVMAIMADLNSGMPTQKPQYRVCLSVCARADSLSWHGFMGGEEMEGDWVKKYTRGIAAIFCLTKGYTLC